MDIHKGDTLSGFVVTVTEGEFVLTLYDNDATFSDGNGEIIVDGLPEYSLKNISDAEAFQLFSYAMMHFDDLKQYMSQMDLE
jgi:hypothetical protein